MLLLTKTIDCLSDTMLSNIAFLTCCHRYYILLEDCFAGTVSDSNKSNTSNQGSKALAFVESSVIKTFEESKS